MLAASLLCGPGSVGGRDTSDTAVGGWIGGKVQPVHPTPVVACRRCCSCKFLYTFMLALPPECTPIPLSCLALEVFVYHMAIWTLLLLVLSGLWKEGYSSLPSFLPLTATILTLRALTLGKSVHASSKNEGISSHTTEKILDLCTDMWPDELDSDGS